MLIFTCRIQAVQINDSSFQFCYDSRASDRMRKKIKEYAEIFGHIMHKHALIMRKLHWIMRKFKQFIELTIRPIQCIYILMVNQDLKLHLQLVFFPLRYSQSATSFHRYNKRVSNGHFAETCAKINKAIKKIKKN